MGKNRIRTPTPWPPGGQFLGFLWDFSKILEGVKLEFRNFTGGLFSQKKEILTREKKLSYGFETLNMTSEGLGEMFEGDSLDT